MACCSCFGPSTSGAGFSPNGKKYSRELQSFSELIYDAGNKDEGRLGGYGSTSGLLRRRNGAEMNMGPTYERHRSAVDDLQDTLRDMSHHERDKLLRTDLLLLAPIVRELFPELPEMHYTYVLPYADDLDEKASDYLSSVLESIRLDLGTTVVPLHTTGDGNCLLHAVSRGIWGVELFSDLLRQRVSQELEDHQAWYESKLSRAEVREAIEQVRQPYRFLSNLHMVALAHVIRRPIILYASHQAVLDFGFGYYGMAGMFGPVRYDVDSWYPRPIAIGWASREHNHFVPLVWSASQAPVEWPVQDEGPRAPLLSRTKSFDLQDPFAVPTATRALLRARAKGTPVAQPVFVQRLVEQIRQQVVQLQGHMLAQMIDSGAFDKSSDEEDDWSSVPIKPPPASSIALSFAPYQEHPNPLLNGRNHAFDFERDQPNVSETPEYFANPVYNPADTRHSGAASSGFVFDPFEPSPGVNNPFLYQLPRSGTSYSESAPVSWPPPKHCTQNAPAAVTRAQSSVQHSNSSSHTPPASVRGKLSIDPHVYHSKQHDFGLIPTAPSTNSLHSETSSASSPKQADRSPRTPRSGSVLNPLSELNPLADPENFTVGANHVTRPNSKPDGADGHAQSADARHAAGARRRTSNEPLVRPVVKRTARLLSADPHPQRNAHRRWKKASNTVRGAVRMRRMALAVKVELPAGFKGSVPWWNLSKDEGRLKVLEGEDPYVTAQAISRSLSKRTRVLKSNEPSDQDGRNPGVDKEDDSKAVVTVRQQNSELIKTARGDGLVGQGQYLKDRNGRLVWVSLAKQITRKMNGVAVADAALRILAKPYPAHRYAAAASRQPEIAMLAGTMVRLAAELKVLTTKPIPGIRVFLPDEDDLFLWHAVLGGPPGTPWEGRSLQLEIHVPEDYPRRPPDRVRFLTEIAHPKVDAAGVPRLGFLNVRSQGPAGKRRGQRDMPESEDPHSVGVKTQGANGMASSSEGQAETGCPGSGRQGSGQLAGAEKCTADEIVEAAEQLLSAASLGTETGTESGRPNGPDGSSESGEKMRGTTWDPYQGLAFVLKSVQCLLSDSNFSQSD